MKINQLLEWGAHGTTQSFQFGKISVTAKRNQHHDSDNYTSFTELTTSIKSFRNQIFHGKGLSGIAKYNRTSRMWESELHGSADSDHGDVVLMSGTGTGQTLELSIQQCLKDFVSQNSSSSE